MAEETKFTRGTLHARRNNSFWDVLSEDGYVVGDTCGAGCWPHGSQEDNETTASAYAHLFAAAPDLYEAVSQMLPLLQDDGDALSAIKADALTAICDRARAVLSRVSPSETETDGIAKAATGVSGD